MKTLPLKKQARLNLIIIACILPCVALTSLMSIKIFGKLFSAELIARNFTIWSYTTLAITAFYARRVFHMSKDAGKILFDERDQLINYRAVLYAYYTICISLTLVLFFSASALGDTHVLIPLYILPLSFSLIAIIVVLVYSVAVLVQYGRGGDNAGK